MGLISTLGEGCIAIEASFDFSTSVRSFRLSPCVVSRSALLPLLFVRSFLADHIPLFFF